MRRWAAPRHSYVRRETTQSLDRGAPENLGLRNGVDDGQNCRLMREKSQVAIGQVRHGQVAHSQVVSGQVVPGHVVPGQAVPGQAASSATAGGYRGAGSGEPGRGIAIARRALVAGALSAPALIGRRATAAAPLKVGFVYVSPIGDAGWSYQHELGRRSLDIAMGDRIKTSFVENVSEGADAERVIRKLAQDGNDLIFTTSFGYMNPTEKVARDFPKTKFEHCTGYKRAANIATYSARFYEGRYLTGIIAGRMTKTNTIGYVAAFPIPEVIQGINAVMLGARSVNPKAEIKVVWTSAWFDPGKEHAAADTLASQGADFLMHHTDSTAVVQAGEEKGIWTCGYDSDMSKYGPRTCTTAVTTDWEGYYIERVRMAMAGAWTSEDTWGGISSGMVKLAPLNKSLPASVASEVATKAAELATARTIVFQGPLRDQSGQDKVAPGKLIPDPDILGMKWFVEGVQGKI